MLSRNCYCGYFWSDTDNLKTKQNQHSHSKQTKHKQLLVNSPYLAGFENPGVNDHAKAFTLSIVKLDANVMESALEPEDQVLLALISLLIMKWVRKLLDFNKTLSSSGWVD